MSKIHYFQRYSQRENWITNSTLLLLNRLYVADAYKFNLFFNNLLADFKVTPDFGVSFHQQIKHKSSVPDGFIRQKSIQLLLETKLNGNYSTEQLVNHLAAFDSNVDERILIGLSVLEPNQKTYDAVYGHIKSDKRYNGIKFACTTYKQVYESFMAVLTDSDYQLKDIAEDYYNLCFEENLIKSTAYNMLAVTAGKSINENLKYGIYYDPVNRNNNSQFKYLGLYNNKSIVGIGEVVKIVECDLIDEGLVIKNNVEVTEEEWLKIVDLIKKTEYYDLAYGNKFYLVDKFHETDFRKVSYGPMRGKSYINLSYVFGDNYPLSTSEIASELKNKTWG